MWRGRTTLASSMRHDIADHRLAFASKQSALLLDSGGVECEEVYTDAISFYDPCLESNRAGQHQESC